MIYLGGQFVLFTCSTAQKRKVDETDFTHVFS